MNIIKSLIKGYENRFGRAFIVIIFVFVALVPSVVLFYGLSSTAIVDVRGAGYTFSLSGSAALFMLLFWYMTKVIFPPLPTKVSVRGTVGHDLQEADSLIRRCGMKLYAVDCQLAWCRYYLKQGEKKTARECWKRAKMGMEVTGYRLREKEIKALE